MFNKIQDTTTILFSTLNNNNDKILNHTDGDLVNQLLELSGKSELDKNDILNLLIQLRRSPKRKDRRLFRKLRRNAKKIFKAQKRIDTGALGNSSYGPIALPISHESNGFTLNVSEADQYRANVEDSLEKDINERKLKMSKLLGQNLNRVSTTFKKLA